MSSLACLAVLALVTLATASAPGPCPPVTTATISDLSKVMGLWWRPFRSQFAPDEPRFKCLSTEWTELQGKRFKVIDNNVDAMTNQKITWNGFIEARANLADWDIAFDENGVLFTREKNVNQDKLNEYMSRVSDAMSKNGLKDIRMLPIFFDDCPGQKE